MEEAFKAYEWKAEFEEVLKGSKVNAKDDFRDLYNPSDANHKNFTLGRVYICKEEFNAKISETIGYPMKVGDIIKLMSENSYRQMTKKQMRYQKIINRNMSFLSQFIILVALEEK